MSKPRYDADGDIKYPACFGCSSYDDIFEVEDGLIVGEFCQRGFDGDCPPEYRDRDVRREARVER